MSTQESIRKDREKILSIIRRKKTGSISYENLEGKTRGRVDNLDFALWSLARSGDVILRTSGDHTLEEIILRKDLL